MAHPDFYPTDFPVTAATGTQALQDSVLSLQSETRQAAVRTLYSRRQLGQQTTRLENAQVVVIADYMPLPRIGQKVQTAVDRIIGGVGFFVGATPDDNSIDQLNLQNLILQPCGVEMITPRSGVGCFHNQGRGYILGGTNWYTEIQQIKQTRTETRYRWV